MDSFVLIDHAGVAALRMSLALLLDHFHYFFLLLLLLWAGLPRNDNSGLSDWLGLLGPGAVGFD